MVAERIKSVAEGARVSQRGARVSQRGTRQDENNCPVIVNVMCLIRDRSTMCLEFYVCINISIIHSYCRTQ